MKFTAAAFFLATSAALTAAAPFAPSSTVYTPGTFHHPHGASEGYYTHFKALDGTLHTTYHGTTPPAGSVNSTHTRRSGGGVQCQGLTFAAGDASAAAAGLAHALDGNPSFFHATSFVSGTAVAYGCDYGNGQHIGGTELTGYINDIAAACGAGKQGYFNIPSAKASYGVTTAGSGFC
ncbi:hypothetical protein PsYK624_027470 [Phanerochaete sordida]|uniref:Uncharacterized protein n=1 Tax=Phanerochaete sordida TaxID=48140 RepID=A0A9P3L8Z1_9APHY|nr:hypothetical protein PsYK624_027470 [Phanerochaete sordida]